MWGACAHMQRTRNVCSYRLWARAVLPRQWIKRYEASTLWSKTGQPNLARHDVLTHVSQQRGVLRAWPRCQVMHRQAGHRFAVSGWACGAHDHSENRETIQLQWLAHPTPHRYEGSGNQCYHRYTHAGHLPMHMDMRNSASYALHI